MGWGTELFDYDNDGLLDIIVANGHVYPQLDQARLGASAPYRQRRLLYHNNGDGTFEEVSAKYGDVLTEPRVSRGLAMTDLDDDGRVDLVLNDLDGVPQLLRNVLEPVGHWLSVKLEGKGQNKSAIGAVVSVKAGTLSMHRLCGAARATSRRTTSASTSASGRTQGRLGRGALAGPDEDALENVAADQVLKIKQP